MLYILNIKKYKYLFQILKIWQLLKINKTKIFQVSIIICFIFIIFNMNFAYCEINPKEYLQLSANDKQIDSPIHILADEIYYNNKIYTTSGNVKITHNNKQLFSDTAIFNKNNMEIFAQGNVLFLVNNDYISCEKLKLYVDRETGSITNGIIFYKQNNLYLKGNNIKKTGKDTFYLDRVSITSCDGEDPDWQITGTDFNIKIEGYATAKNIAFWIKKIPIFYSPFFIYPVKLKRQSGLLMPGFEYSDRKGISYEQPFYWAINKKSDITFYENYISKRGLKHGFEFRYVLNDFSKGALYFDFLSDRIIDNFDSENDSLYDLYNDDIYFNKDRYWFRMKNDHKFANDFVLNIDIDIISDHYFLHEFNNSIIGYDKLKSYFLEKYGRDIDPKDDSIRSNRISLNKKWSDYYFGAEILWFDDLIARQKNNETISQRLPSLMFNSLKQNLFNSNMLFNFNTTYTNFYSENGNKGHRAIINPLFSYPIFYKNYFRFEPSIELKSIFWHVDDEKNSGSKSFENQNTYKVKGELFTEIFKVFNVNSESIQQIKHSIIPEITYEYSCDKEDKHQYFNYLDLPEKQNKIKWEIINTFVAKTSKDYVTGLPESQRYLNFLKIKISQYYDINEEIDYNDEKKSFSPISSELEFTNRNISFKSESLWSCYDRQFLNYNTMAKIFDNFDNFFLVEHRYNRKISQSLFANMNYNIFYWLQINSSLEYDLLNHNLIESNLKLTYKSQCYSVDILFSDNEIYDDKSLSFMLHLNGFE